MASAPRRSEVNGEHKIATGHVMRTLWFATLSAIGHAMEAVKDYSVLGVAPGGLTAGGGVFFASTLRS